MAAELNIPSKTIERWIKRLREQGKIVFTGSRKAGGWRVCFRFENGEAYDVEITDYH